MENIIKIIRAGVICGALMVAFTGEVFAATTLLPVSVVDISSTSAVLHGYAEISTENSIVWFEWSEASSMSAPVILAQRNFYGNGLFSAQLNGLTPGTAYSFRSVARGAGATVYSPVFTFTTLGVSASSYLGASNRVALGGGTTNIVKNSSTLTPTQTTSQSKNVASNKLSTVTTSSKKATDGATKVSNDSGLSSNAASAFGAGGSVMPTTLIGWVALIISILVAVLIIRMIFESNEKRNKVDVPHGEEAVPHLA